jgi:hypothetical protein
MNEWMREREMERGREGGRKWGIAEGGKYTSFQTAFKKGIIKRKYRIDLDSLPFQDYKFYLG